MLKEKIKESDEMLTEKGCMWRNYYFGKNGKKHPGEKLHDSQQAAALGMERSLKRAEIAAKNDPSGDCWLGKVGSGLLLSEFAWGMQIPVLE